MVKTIVSIVRVPFPNLPDNVFEAVEKAVSLSGWKSNICRGKKIIIKPNLSTNDMLNTTNPLVTSAVVRLAIKFGAKEVVVGDSSVVGMDTNEVLQKTLTSFYCEKAGARIANFKEGTFRKVPLLHSESPFVQVAEEICNADVMINLPKMKTVPGLGISGALKNLKGVLHDSDKKKFHRIGINEAVCDLNAAIHSDLIIMDAIEACEMMVKTVPVGLIIAGENSLSVDAVATRTMGHDPFQIDMLRMAYKKGIGPINEEEITIVGEPIESIKLSINIPQGELDELIPVYFPQFPRDKILIINGDACTGCTSQILSALAKINKKIPHLFDLLTPIIFVIGPSATIPLNDKRRIILVGSCTKKLIKQNPDITYINGCVPWSMDIINAIYEGDTRL